MTPAGTPCAPTRGRAPPANYELVHAGTTCPPCDECLYAGLTWPMRLSGSRHCGGADRAHIYANDLTPAAAGYWVEDLRFGFEQESRRWRFTSFQCDNLANRSYVGSVIVNESNSRFFEAPGGTPTLCSMQRAWPGLINYMTSGSVHDRRTALSLGGSFET